MPEKHVYLSIASEDASSDVLNLAYKAAKRAGTRIWHTDESSPTESTRQSTLNALKSAFLLIADISRETPLVMHDVGFAQAQRKPVILIADKSRSIPFDLTGLRVLLYGQDNRMDFIQRLEQDIRRAMEAPQDFILAERSAEKAKRPKLFLSYSRHDRDYLDRLLVHLRPLEREGLVDLWADTRLRAGDQWKEEITKALNVSTVAVLLVSADFLASDFIVNNELPPILKKAAEKGTRVIPLIVKPCRYTRHADLRQFQAVNDPSKALILLGEGEQELQYDAVAEEVERALERG